MIKIHAHLVGEEICLKQDKERQCPSPMRWLVLWHVESNCNASKCSASRQQVQECRERSEARDCQQPRLLLGKLLPSSQTLIYPCCRTPSEGGGRSPVSRCPPEPTQSQSGSFRRLGLPGIFFCSRRFFFLHCSCVVDKVRQRSHFLFSGPWQDGAIFDGTDARDVIYVYY